MLGVGLTLPIVARAAASVDVTELEIPTYGFSDPDPIPDIDARHYPYFRYDGSSHTAMPRKWKAVILENKRIRITILPEIGGKIWGATDKTTGRDFIYYNHVVKFRNIATRGPWTSGGIEFNFGLIGHATSTATPVDWCVRTNADQSASYFCSNHELVLGTTWQVEVNLKSNDDFFTLRTKWANTSNDEMPYYQWMNGAFASGGNAELGFPGDFEIGHEGDAHPWPMKDGRAVNFVDRNDFGGNKSYHVVGGDSRVFGVWWNDWGIGAYHENEMGDKYGRKAWIWALSREGAIWEDLLTDKDGQYMELQSGRGFNQPRRNTFATPFKHPTFAAGGVDAFEERWGIVRARTDFDLRCGRRSESVHRAETMPSDFNWNSAYGHYVRGEQALAEFDFSTACSNLQACLKLESCFVPALNALARIEYWRNHLAKAEALVEKSLAINAYDAEANFRSGRIAADRGETLKALERFGLAAYSPSHRTAAEVLSARLSARQADWDEVLRRANLALDSCALSIDAAALRALALRKSGRKDEACKSLVSALQAWPLAHALRYEAYRCGMCTRDDFTAAIRNELSSESYLDIALSYVDCGCVEEALELFAMSNSFLGNLATTYLKSDATMLQQLTQQRVRMVFPRGHWMAKALDWAQAHSTDWKFAYLRAVQFAVAGDIAKARELLNAVTNADEPVFYQFRAKVGDNCASRLNDLERAAALEDSWRIGKAKMTILAETKDWAGVKNTGEDYLRRFPDCNAIQIAYAHALIELKEYQACLDFLRDVTILPSEFGDNATDSWHAAQDALGLPRTWPERLGRGKPYAGVPYEFERANRTTDDVAPFVDFEDGDNWRVAAFEGEGKTSFDGEDRLFGGRTLRLDFRGAGENAAVEISPSQCKALPDKFDTIYIWVKGNCFGVGANTDPNVPTPTLYARFRLVDGKELEMKLSDINWPDWHQVNRRLTALEIEALKGGSFVGLTLKGGKQSEWRSVHFDNLAIFVDSLKTPIAINPRPRRALTPIPGAVQGVNTGKDRLKFPTSERTIIPKTGEPAKDDLLATFNGGAVNVEEAKALRLTERRMGKSLIVDFFAPAGTVREVTAGSASEAKVIKSFIVPYFKYGAKDGRIKVDLLEGGWFRSAVFDWYRSNASHPSAHGGEFTMRYLSKTDGTYNPVSERLVITLSRDFQEVLPEIPNPVSPYRMITGKNAWRAHASYQHDFDKKFWAAVKAAGIRHVVINDHETLWRDRGESFTCRKDAAPGRGGDEGAYDYTRFLRDKLHYEYGPYNNFTDFSPMNANWRRDLIARRSDGSFQPAWVRCYGPKPTLALELCERIVPEAQMKFGFSTAYCDVHTAVFPWSRTDYDARIPGAATFAQTYYAWGELMMLQKRLWEGPVYSEGGCHFMYAGLSDGNYAQDGGYNFLTMPWIVDFDLLKIHPKECDFGMGTLSMFSPGKTPNEIRFYQPHAPTEKDRDELIDLFLTASAAFGHAPFLILDYCFDPPKPFGLAYGGAGKLCLEKGMPIALKSYAMLQPIAARYTQSEVKKIAYFGANGQEFTSSEAIANGEIARNQLAVVYADGTIVVANGNQREHMKVVVEGVTVELPTRAFKAWTSDGQVRAEIIETADGGRRYYSECPEFVYDSGFLIVLQRKGEL